MPVGQLQGSLLSATQQTQIALANFNFDFTLYKAPAPPQYIGLGSALSSRRRRAAEDGHEHVVARKLGRLFHGYLPAIPTLIGAYGERASAIAASDVASRSGSHADGVFAEYVGADGTTIWAAATSSPEAISVHLLACMLARIWQPLKATAIWAEIIEERQAELMMLDSSDPLRLSEIAAARLDLTREDLANWDASARAWLSIADEVMRREQTQLLLIVDKTRLPVDLSTGVYNSVMRTWKSALSTVNSILEGMAYNVQDGAVLLGLTAWHLFPDIHVLLKGSAKHIEQRDPVAQAAGLLTFGIEGRSPDEDDGIRWSLPLAHLRYYGDPITSRGAVGTTSLRLTMQEFHQVLLGCVIASWGRHSEDVSAAVKLIKSMWDFVCRNHSELHDKGKSSRILHSTNWLRLLGYAADEFVSAQGLLRQHYERLVERGLRRYDLFLTSAPDAPGPMFNLENLNRVISILNEEGVVQLLRHIGRDYDGAPTDMLIRYRNTDSLGTDGKLLSKTENPEAKTENTENSIETDPEDDYNQRSLDFLDDTLLREDCDDWSVDFLDDTLFPEDDSVDKPSSDHSDQSNTRRKRKSTSLTAPVGPTRKRSKKDASKIAELENVKALLPVDSGISGFEYATVLPFPHLIRQRDQSKSEDGPEDPSSSGQHLRWLRHTAEWDERERRLHESGEDTRMILEDFVTDLNEKHFTVNILPGSSSGFYTSDRTRLHYSFLCGRPYIGSIFRRKEVEISLNDKIGLETLTSAFDTDLVNLEKFIAHLERLEAPEFIRSMKAMSSVTAVYKTMPNATITMNVFLLNIGSSLWFPQVKDLTDDPLEAYVLDRPSTFACIAMFEHGSLNIDPRDLTEVMALSVGNSIYVAMPLLCDPCDHPESYEVRRVVGNIGRAGVSFLIPPPNPKVKKLTEDSWAMISHATFDGRFENNFASTSMHLAFTKSRIPVGYSIPGGQDVEACFCETLVSVYNSDVQAAPGWIADLDILGALKHPLFSRMDPTRKCKHSGQRKEKPSFLLRSVDSWEEFLDRPRTPAVVRASGNWLARLAAAALNVQQGFPTIVIHKDHDNCWACALEQYQVSLGSNKQCSQDYQPSKLPFFIC